MSHSPETLNRIAQYRAKMADGTITLDDLRSAVILMRSDRITAVSTAGAPKRSKAPAKSAESMLSELDNL